MLGGAGSRALEPMGRGGAGRVVSREAECSSGPDVRNSSQGAGTGVVQGSTVIPGTSMSSSGASGVYSVCIVGVFVIGVQCHPEFTCLHDIVW